MKKLYTLCHIHTPERILLGMKKRRFGEGWWNGYGGKVNDGETIEQAADREIREETRGIRALRFDKRGILNFEFEGDPVLLEVHVFRVTQFEGEPEETEEMKPRWFSLDDIPYDEMWPADRYWIPLLLAEKKFLGMIKFGQDKRTLLDYQIQAVDQLP